jgi:XapX domain-containing protein
MNYLFGLLIAFGIGVFCRWTNLPLPAPPTLLGVLLIFAITAGFMAADWYLKR